MSKVSAGKPIKAFDWLRKVSKTKPVEVKAPGRARAPLPTAMSGETFLLGCSGRVSFTLTMKLPTEPQPTSWDMSEDEVRRTLALFGVSDVPQVVSAAKYWRLVQVVPNWARGVPQQVICLFARDNAPKLDFRDVVDHEPQHETLTTEQITAAILGR